MQILNLDKLNKAPSRSLKLDRVDHPIVPLTVEGFIETTSAVEKIVSDGSGMLEQLNATIDMILRQVPSIDRAALLKLDPETLETIVRFVRGDEVDGAEEVATEAGK